MGEQDDKIFYYDIPLVVHGTGRITSSYPKKLRINWDILLSVVLERFIQAGELGLALIITIKYAQSRGGLC